jgi:TorA maturation chaperone TorD
MENNTMIDSVRTRLTLGDCCRLLAVFFYEPDITLWRKEKLCTYLAGLLKNISIEAALAAEQMEKSLEDMNDEQTAVDYAALFVGPFELLAPPYGSVYLETTKRLMGDSTMAVMRMYQEAGLSVDVKEAPDHIAIELEFMHYLYTLEAEAIHKDDNVKAQSLASMRNDFLSAYLATWIPQFCEKIGNGADNMFYRNLADCLENFIKHETASLPLINADGATKHACQAAV